MTLEEGEVCRNGHTRTADNTSMVYDAQRDRYRKRCLVCNRTGVVVTGYVGRVKDAVDNFWVKVANLDELMEFGADAREIPERAGWAHRQSMRKGLQRKNLHEIWERYQTYAATN